MTRSPKDFPSANNLRLPDSLEHNVNARLSGDLPRDQPVTETPSQFVRDLCATRDSICGLYHRGWEGQCPGLSK